MRMVFGLVIPCSFGSNFCAVKYFKLNKEAVDASNIDSLTAWQFYLKGHVYFYVGFF